MLDDARKLRLGADLLLVVVVALAVVVDDTALRVGLFGLLGTLAGAMATLEATHMASQAEATARKRAAGRLLQEDLHFARTRCANATRNGRFWAPRLDLRLDGWERYRETVAVEFGKEASAWRDVAAAFEAMRSVQSKCDGLRVQLETDRPGLGPLSREVIGEYMQRSDAALDALQRLSGDRPEDEPVMAESA